MKKIFKILSWIGKFVVIIFIAIAADVIVQFLIGHNLPIAAFVAGLLASLLLMSTQIKKEEKENERKYN